LNYVQQHLYYNICIFTFSSPHGSSTRICLPTVRPFTFKGSFIQWLLHEILIDVIVNYFTGLQLQLRGFDELNYTLRVIRYKTDVRNLENGFNTKIIVTQITARSRICKSEFSRRDCEWSCARYCVARKLL